MSISCPYCAHPLKLKSVRAGKFQPKCSKCAKPFLLTVSDDAEPVLRVTALPGQAAAATSPDVTAPPVTAPSTATNLDATVAPAQASDDNADFSVSPSVFAPSNPDAPTALEESAPLPAPGRRAAYLEATEAGDSDTGEQAEKTIDGEIPSVLGNYQVVKELGRGGMGAVYLARQMSLDRPVALKVMNSAWASNPAFLVRFTREAYAAAQLVHHNVVQVYDIGADKGINYFSMEFVDGRSIGDLLKKEGKLGSEVAAGYILQAARGLKFAHERGMVHRDIKPDNLMLNSQGIVKVADLGLVRTPGMPDEKAAEQGQEASPAKAKESRSLASLSGVTMVGQAMGTPSYMAPEQARDATRVDHRADIYSLGCTLYVMVTGRPVFSGSNAMEVMTAHATQPIVRPDVVVKEVPRGLGDIVCKMIAKKPDDRYAGMDDVIKALEDFLGLQGSSKLAQSEKHLRTLEGSVKEFQDASSNALRSYILLAFFGGCAALFLLFLLAWRVWSWGGFMAAVVLGLGTLTGLAYFVVSGLSQKGPLFLKVRELVFSLSLFDYLKLGAGLLLFLFVLWLINLFWPLFLAAILAVGLALGLHFAIDRKVAGQQTQALQKVEHLLRTLRRRGISEEALQEFVAKNAGDHWEGYFEALFGYETKLAARAQYGRGPKGHRPKFAGWRDPLIRWIDAYQRARQEARERQHLRAVEQANLVAQGVSAAQAREQAEAVADALVQVAADIRQQAAPAPQPPAPEPPPAPAPARTQPSVVEETVAVTPRPKPLPPRRVGVEELIRMASVPEKVPPAKKSRSVAQFFEMLFGGGIRFLLGAALILMAMGWLSVRNSLPTGERGFLTLAGWWWKGTMPDPLVIPLVPTMLQADVMRALCSLSALAAGFVLVLSAIWRSWRIGVMVLLAAAVMVAGPVLIAPYVPTGFILHAEALCLVAGGLLAMLGFLFGRNT